MSRPRGFRSLPAAGALALVTSSCASSFGMFKGASQQGQDINQLWRIFFWAAIVVTAVLAFLAWRAVGTDDRLGGIVVVQLFGLLLSPISWTHHWVWLLPLMIWLLHGPLRERRGARILGWGWLALTIVGVPWLLSFAQPTIWVISRPWYLAWAGLIYIVATLVTLAWIGSTGRRSRRSLEPSPHPCP